MSLLLRGTGASHGIAIGRVHFLSRNIPEAAFYSIAPKQVRREITRFKSALELSGKHLRSIRDSIPSDTPADVSQFIDSHLLMLSDDLLTQAVTATIKTELCNAEWALKLYHENIMTVFDRMEDEYLKTRRDDISHVVQLIQRFLHDVRDSAEEIKSPESLQNTIIVTDDLTPADTILLQHRNILAFVTEFGGPTSHTTILARSFGIPAIVAVHRVRSLLHEGEQIIVDGNNGMVLAGADKKTLAHYRSLRKRNIERKKNLRSLRNKKARTLDHVNIKLLANIELVEDIRLLRQSGAEGVGLYRTEFLYLERTHEADEEEHLHAYCKAIKAVNGKPVVIRTLDIGAEKEFDPGYAGPLALNPALGLRAIRRSLKQPDSFLLQLRAILRASAKGKVHILLPMLTSIGELDQVFALLDEAKRQLTLEKHEFNKRIPVGGMVEVPAAALQARAFARRLDFLSIGTNDLIQYTLASDRIDEEVNYLYDPLHPGVIRLIKSVIREARAVDTPVAMCGEMAGDPQYTRLLLGLGLREFSAHPSTLGEIKEIILNSNVESLVRRCRRITAISDRKKIAEFIDRLNQ